MNSYEAYCLFLGLSRHFKTPSYDYFKYNGKVNVKVETFEKRNDKHAFHRLSRKPDPHGLILSNLLKNPKCWVTDCLTKDGDRVYNEWCKVNQSLQYVFRKDLNEFLDIFDYNFKIEDGHYPKIIQNFLQQKITMETVIIIDKLTNFMEIVNGKIIDTVIWPGIYQKIIKYRPFIQVDLEIYRNVVIQKFQ